MSAQLTSVQQSAYHRIREAGKEGRLRSDFDLRTVGALERKGLIRSIERSIVHRGKDMIRGYVVLAELVDEPADLPKPEEGLPPAEEPTEPPVPGVEWFEPHEGLPVASAFVAHPDEGRLHLIVVVGDGKVPQLAHVTNGHPRAISCRVWDPATAWFGKMQSIQHADLVDRPRVFRMLVTQFAREMPRAPWAVKFEAEKVDCPSCEQPTERGKLVRIGDLAPMCPACAADHARPDPQRIDVPEEPVCTCTDDNCREDCAVCAELTLCERVREAAVAAVRGDPPIHEWCSMFPAYEEPELRKLADDILANGLLEPIVLFEGKVLDGRNRLAACRRSGVDPRFVEFDGPDALAFVVAKNLHRRHLTESQRAMLGARLEGLREAARQRQEASRIGAGGQRSAAPAAPSRKASEDAAAIVGASARLVEYAGKVQREGTPELVAAVDAGKVQVFTAADLVKLPAEEQRALVEAADPKIVRQAAKAARDKAAAERKARDLARREELAAKAGQAMPELAVCDLRLAKVADVLPSVRGAALVHADPPWKYNNHGNGHAEAHYETMTIPEIVSDLAEAYGSAADDAYLVVWATCPMLEDWFRHVDSDTGWRWRFATAGAWGKTGGIGVGFHWRGDAEIVLVYTKGRPKPIGTLGNWHLSERTEHSEKPEEWLRMMVGSFAPAGSVVLDLYAGRAPLARACLATHRRYVGAESDPERHREAMLAIAPLTPLFPGREHAEGPQP
jgi:N6-adenosine-specific RNA methylase IME4/ParB-like chromosome segregation protein Spo0J